MGSQITTLPIIETNPEGAYFYDSKGKRYIDCYCGAGMFNLGRHVKELSNTLCEQADKSDQGNFVLISQEKALLASKLVSFVPAPIFAKSRSISSLPNLPSILKSAGCIVSL